MLSARPATVCNCPENARRLLTAREAVELLVLIRESRLPTVELASSEILWRLRMASLMLVRAASLRAV